VAKPDVLARVKSDLAHGRTHIAIQRLRTLIAIDPDDLEVREALASVYRMTGNLQEAGRWSFLAVRVVPEEIAAFERANPQPWLRLRLLRYSADPFRLSPPARDRLLALAERASETGPPAIWSGPSTVDHEPRRGVTVPCLFVSVALAVFAVLAAIGVYRSVLWIMHY
jgi:hypothetical protein